jgi:hypothetical protein
MTEQRIHTWAQRRRVRVVALAAVIVGPLAAVPFLLASTATAASPSTAAVAACLNAPEGITVLSFDGPAGTATVELNGPGCQTVSLVSYDTPGLPLANGDAQYPQTEVAAETVPVTQADGIVTLNVAEPSCFSQLDLIYGLNQDGTSAVLATLNPVVLPDGTTEGPYSAEGILIAHKDFVQATCTTPPTTSSAPPTTTSSAPPTTTSSAPPTTTSSAPPTTTSSAPPTTTSSAPPTTTSSAPPTTLSTSVLPTSTSRPPTSTTSAVATKSTAVLPFTTTRPPLDDVTGGALPFTGSNLPVRDGVLGGLALVTFGGLLVLVAGRTKRRAGTHRVG